MTRLGTPRHFFESALSTMDCLTELALQGAPEGTIVVAGEQTAGRGRAGRRWVTPPGTALLMSVLLRPRLAPSELSPLPLIAGLAVAEGIESVAGDLLRESIDLKWPNDLYVAGRKICGVLMQSRSGASGVAFVNLGIGVNINTPSGRLPETATSLLDLTGIEWPVDEIERAVLHRLIDRYDEWLREGSAPGLETWFRRALYRNESVQIENAGSETRGVFTGVNKSGALQLETDNGAVEIVAGDLTRGPRLA